MYKFLSEAEVLVIDTGRVIFLNDPPTLYLTEYQKWLAEGNTPEPADIPEPVVITVTSACCAVDEHCGKIISAGFVFGENTYQINGDAQDNIGKRATYAGWSKLDPVTFPWVEPYSLGWWDINNVWHAMTANEFMLFAKAVSDYVSACAACCRNHKNAITPENCETYDYTTGWPVNPQ